MPWPDTVPEKPLKERLGHSRTEVLVGSLMGPAIALPGLDFCGFTASSAVGSSDCSGVTSPPHHRTDQQEAAAAAFSDWLQQKDAGLPFVLSGFAGSGKTFLSMRLLREVEASGLCWTVVAPTHKAVGVLRQALTLGGPPPHLVSLHHSSLVAAEAQTPGDAELCEPTEQTAAALEHLGLVLIDEASMVDSSLLSIALQCAHPFKTRLVFVGDPAQLPPGG